MQHKLSVKAWRRIHMHRQILTHKPAKASAKKPRSESKLACFISGPGRRAQTVKEKLSHQADITEKWECPLACVRAKKSSREEITKVMKGDKSI